MNWLRKLSPWSKKIDSDLIPEPAKTTAPGTETETQLRDVVRIQKAHIRKLQDENADLKGQNLEYRKSRVLSPEEDAIFTQMRADNQALLDQQNKLALWLRNNKGPEIDAGKHNGMDLSDIIIMYLGQTIPDRQVIQ